ncbi:Transcription initiation factor TFIID subunit 8 [Metarhizium brunneum]|uniref:Transcription initiation factor TFIID subunit 8 n=4 Tax=Metarhizium TaxID=5529 RepID=E9F7J1_METRA
MSSKRSLSPSDSDGSSKRRRLSGPHPDCIQDDIVSVDMLEARDDNEVMAVKSFAPTHHANARTGIQRSIALVLKHDGFSSATPEAMESFTALVETYLESIIEETKRLALSSRRDHPVPMDFEAVLRRFNLPVSSLKPHLKNPLPAEAYIPRYKSVHVADDDAYTTLPLLGPELSGQPDKKSKSYIPSNFPDFPSRHTYKFTPQEDTNARDAQKTREEAARIAQQGEDALRRLVRASKMRKQKEAKNLVEKDVQGKERFRLWELTMKRFMGAENRGENTDNVDIADHSMIVNGDAVFSRKEVSRIGKRLTVLPSKGN